MLPGRRTFNGALFGSNLVPPPGTPLVGGIAVSPGGIIYMDGLGAAWDPAQLFVNSEQGCWYDPSDLTSMFQDAAGTVPVTAVEQPVGRINDKSGKGNHATQATSTKRPVLSARVNRLTKTEDFGDAVWSGYSTTTVAPSGGMFKVSENNTTESHVFAQNGVLPSAASVKSFYVEAKAAERTWVYLSSNDGSFRAFFDLTNGVVGSKTANTISSIVPLGSGVYGCSMSTNSASTAPGFMVGLSTADNVINYAGVSGSGALFNKAQAEVGTATTYQRVNTATDYNTVGFKHYLKFDGVDDSLGTASIDFTATDKMSVFTGVRKLSDAGQIIVELSKTIGSVPGTFAHAAGNAVGGFYGCLAAGNAAISGAQGAQYLVSGFPDTCVLTGLHDIPGDSSVGRRNATQFGNGVADKGTGSFANQPIYIGSRGGTSLPFNGHLYQLVVLGRLASPTEIDDTELYIAHKTGVTLS